ncbi:glycosyl transferases group 1 [Ferrovum sp. JA12]|uniref:glycosyltransferase n=1 Tax=Ferrovum sp. JA12 TaxID=1356299 RepID=UPI000702A3D2|nr:glycosyltransferase [Ferrovum sp. JA12]KRH79054.1 glycosyl transferases group 1 [Ferrovum sp. JA12]HQU08109.1 glycosyltransferase [Candidatus Paceibacterota bacterium]
MKVLLTTYSTAFAISGGGESEIVQVSETLFESGHLVDIYGTQCRPINFYDGYMHFSVHGHGWDIFQILAKQCKPVLLWPNIWWRFPPSPEELLRVTEFVKLAHKLLFKTKAERDNFLQYVDCPINKTVVLPICLSERLLGSPDLALAKTITEFSSYVISLGRVEPVKNQLNLIRALNSLNVNGVIVGGSNNTNYLAQCKAESQGRIVFLPFVKPASKALVSLLAGAVAVAEPCYDPSGRSSLEAALLNKPLVLSQSQDNFELLSNNFYAVDPDSVMSIAKGIQEALLDKNNNAEMAGQLVRSNNIGDAVFERFASMVVDAFD